MTVRVTFLGSGSAFADGGRSHACIHVTAPGVSLLLDCGGSALPAIQRAGVSHEIEAIAVSHLHGDHFGGIPFLAIQQHFTGRTRPLTIAGPPALAARLRATERGLYPDFFERTPLAFELRVVTFGADDMPLGGAMVSALPVLHVAESDPHGIRVRAGGKLIAYSGDARWSEHLPHVARGADLFICESTFFEYTDPSHVNYRELVRHRDELECGRIVLTHLGRETLDHLSELELDYATDGLVLEV